jgi:hypothetical protein
LRHSVLVLILISTLVLVCGCERYPAACSPPPQRPNDFGPDPSLLHAMNASTRMDSPWVRKYLVEDIDTSPGQGRRWTYEHPEMRFTLENKANQRLVVNFIVHSGTFKDTGPFTVDFLVNGKPVGKMRCAEPEEHRFEAPVPQALLESAAETRVAFQLDKYWIAPADGVKLGILLVDVGFYAR